MARPTLLSVAVIQRIADAVAMGGTPETAGVSSRSVRRWRARGRAELDALSLEARLELAIGRAEDELEALALASGGREARCGVREGLDAARRLRLEPSLDRVEAASHRTDGTPDRRVTADAVGERVECGKNDGSHRLIGVELALLFLAMSPCRELALVGLRHGLALVGQRLPQVVGVAVLGTGGEEPRPVDVARDRR